MRAISVEAEKVAVEDLLEGAFSQFMTFHNVERPCE